MKAFGITGWKNSGKTRLMVALIKELGARGYRVSTVKHAHEGFDIDVEGKDSWRHRQAGAAEVIVASAHRWALTHEIRNDEEETALDELLSRLGPCDIALVEGYKTHKHEKIQVYRGGRPDETLMAPGDPTIVAVVTDQDVGDVGVTVFPPDDITAIANFVLGRVGLEAN